MDWISWLPNSCCLKTPLCRQQLNDSLCRLDWNKHLRVIAGRQHSWQLDQWLQTLMPSVVQRPALEILVSRQGAWKGTQDAFSNRVCNYTHHFMYVILIAYIISGMLVRMFTQLWNLHVTFLCAYANFITYFHMQSSENMRTRCCVASGCTHLWAESRLSQSHPQHF